MRKTRALRTITPIVWFRVLLAWPQYKLFGVRYVYTTDFDGEVRLRRVRHNAQGLPCASAIVPDLHTLDDDGRIDGGNHYMRQWRAAFQTKADKVVSALAEREIAE